MFLEMIDLYGMELIGLLLVMLFGTFGLAAKRLLDTPVKQLLAKAVVRFVEQVYKELHGEDKLNAALNTLSQLLAQRGIHATEQEMTVLLEAAVAELNNVFHT